MIEDYKVIGISVVAAILASAWIIKLVNTNNPILIRLMLQFVNTIEGNPQMEVVEHNNDEWYKCDFLT